MHKRSKFILTVFALIFAINTFAIVKEVNSKYANANPINLKFSSNYEFTILKDSIFTFTPNSLFDKKIIGIGISETSGNLGKKIEQADQRAIYDLSISDSSNADYFGHPQGCWGGIKEYDYNTILKVSSNRLTNEFVVIYQRTEYEGRIISIVYIDRNQVLETEPKQFIDIKVVRKDAKNIVVENYDIENAELTFLNKRQKSIILSKLIDYNSNMFKVQTKCIPNKSFFSIFKGLDFFLLHLITKSEALDVMIDSINEHSLDANTEFIYTGLKFIHLRLDSLEINKGTITEKYSIDVDNIIVE